MDKKEFSYALGLNLANNFTQQNFISEIDIDSLSSGLKDAVSGSGKFSLEHGNQIINDFLGALSKEVNKEFIAAGEKFLADNSKKEGITTLDSGLQYEIITEGNGNKPGPNDQVTTHYHGSLIDGTVFDSSVDRGQPATFGVGQVIKGWTEALQLMPEGSKWRLFIPSNLAYGEQGAGETIKPYSTLVFEVELLSIG